MLNPAEELLVVRDPDLPGLRLLLDDERLAAWVNHLLGREVTVRRRHLRYKPTISCVVHADAEGVPLLVLAYSSAGRGKLGKTRHQAPTGAVLGADRALGVLLCSPAADRDLPALAALHDEQHRQSLLVRLLGPDTAVPDGAVPELLRYKPHRRWVGLVHTTGGTPVLLRAHRTGAAEAAAATLQQLPGGEPRTPRLLGLDRSHGITAVQFLPGTPTHETAGRDTYADPAEFGAVGAALAQLHRRQGLRLPARPLATDAAAVRAAAAQLVVMLPELAEPVTALVERIADGMGALDELRVPVHGDFSADQAVVDGAGRVGLIDLDSAGLGDPDADLGCAAAALARDVTLGRLTDADRALRLNALREGYRDGGGAAGEHRVALHTAAHLLRRAIEPFRLGLTSEWPHVARELVERAGTTLSAPASGQKR